MTFEKVEKAVHDAIPYYANKIASKSGVEFDDAKQELSIVVWKSSVKYANKSDDDIRRFVMSDLYFKSLTMVSKYHRNNKTVIGIPSEYQGYNPIDALVDKIALDQEIERVAHTSMVDAQIYKLRRQGYSYHEIVKNTNAPMSRVRKLLAG